MFLLLTGLLLIFLHETSCVDFEDNFENCRRGDTRFDECVREGLNVIRPYFKTGLPKYNIAPFDPFFAEEVSASRGLPGLGFTIVLRNVTESGWSSSKVTKFVSDLTNYKVRYTQSFPKKVLVGDYEFTGTFFGTKIKNKGKFTLTLCEYLRLYLFTLSMFFGLIYDNHQANNALSIHNS